MAPSTTTEIKNNPSKDSLSSKYRQSQWNKDQSTGSTPSIPFKGPGANTIATTVTSTSTQNLARVEQAEDEKIASVSTNDSSTLLELKDPPLDLSTDPKIPLDLTVDDNVHTGLNAANDSGTDAAMSVVGFNGDAPASDTTPALTSPVDTLMSRKSISGGTGQSKSGIRFDNKNMTHNKKFDGIDLTGDEQRDNDPANPVKKLGFCEIGGSNMVDQLKNQQLMNNTAANATFSLQVAALNKTVTPVWKLSRHQPRSASSAVIPQSVWKKIKPLQDVGDIKLASTNY